MLALSSADPYKPPLSAPFDRDPFLPNQNRNLRPRIRCNANADSAVGNGPPRSQQSREQRPYTERWLADSSQPKAEAARFRLPIRGLSCGNTLQSRLRHLSRVLERGEYTPTQLVEYASHAGRTGTQIGLTGLHVSGLAYTVFMGSETGGSALRGHRYDSGSSSEHAHASVTAYRPTSAESLHRPGTRQPNLGG